MSSSNGCEIQAARAVKWGVVGIVVAMLFVGCESAKQRQERYNKIQAELTQKIRDKSMAASQADRLKEIAVDPLATPDFLGEPEFSLKEDVGTFVQAARREAKDAQTAARAHREVVATQNPALGLLVPVHLKATTQQQFDDQYFEYRLQELEAYRQQTADAGEAKAAGERFLRAYVEMAVRRRDDPSDEQTLQLGKSALAAGSQDPLVRTYHAYLQMHVERDLEGAERTLGEMIRVLPGTKYPRIVQMLARSWLYELARRSSGKKDSEDRWPADPQNRWQAVVVATVRWLEGEADRPEWRRCVYHRFLTVWELNKDQGRPLLLAGCLQARKIDPWLLHTVLGNYDADQAWVHRGGQYANEVKPEQWKLFHENLTLASNHLQYAWHLHPEFPEPASRMIAVAMGGEGAGTSPYEWFQRATEAQMDHYMAYRALWYSLYPRWGGSVTQMIQLGHRCLETDRFDTAIPSMAVGIVEAIEEDELEPGQALGQVPGIQSLLRAYLARRDTYRKSHPDRPLFDDNPSRRTQLALLLDKCELPAEATAEFRDLGEKADLLELQAEGKTGAFDLAVRLAAQGANTARVLALADKLRWSWDRQASDSAVAECETEIAELESTAVEPQAKLFYRHARRMLEQLREYSSGKWVDLTFDSELLGWEVSAEKWAAEEEAGAVRISCRKAVTKQLRIRALAGFRPPLVVEADLEAVDPPPYPQAVGIHWCGSFGSPKTDWDFQQPLFGMQAYTGQRWADGPLIRQEKVIYPAEKLDMLADRFDLETVGRRRLRVKLWNEAYEYQLDDEWRAGPLSTTLRADATLSFGEPGHRVDGGSREKYAGELRVAHVRVRRLDTPPPPAVTATPAESQAYWQARLVEDDADPQAHLELARLDLAEGRYDEAITHAQRALEACPKIRGPHSVLGFAHYRAGRDWEAVTELSLATQDPRYGNEVNTAIAEILATSPDDKVRSGANALTFAQMSMTRAGEDHLPALAAMAAAYAELGDFQKAVEWSALTIATAHDDNVDKPRWQQRHELYKAGKPYRRER